MGEIGVEGEIVVTTAEDGGRGKIGEIESSFLERDELFVVGEIVAFPDDDHGRVVVFVGGGVEGSFAEDEGRFGVEGFLGTEECGSGVNGIDLVVEGVGSLPAECSVVVGGGVGSVVEEGNSGPTPAGGISPVDGGEFSLDPVVLLFGIDDPAGIDPRFVPLKYPDRFRLSSSFVAIRFGELDAIGVKYILRWAQSEEERFSVRGETENPVMIPFYGGWLVRLCVRRSPNEGGGGGGRPSEDSMRLREGVRKRSGMERRRTGGAGAREREQKGEKREKVHMKRKDKSKAGIFRQVMRSKWKSGIIVATIVLRTDSCYSLQQYNSTTASRERSDGINLAADTFP